jgi:L-ribulokinase
MSQFVIGLDYGSDSVRALLVDTADGRELASHVVNYPRWAKGLFCAPQQDQFRQHPQDYLDGLQQVLQGLWQRAPKGSAAKVIGVSVDTTGSTPVAISRQGVPLALLPEFATNPNAMFVLWKDHTAVNEAAEITAAAIHAQPQLNPNYLQFMGGIYSSEWFWAKALHVLRQDPQVRAATYSFVEHCDWITAVLTGTTAPTDFRMGRCATGHKMMWHQSWNGFPPNAFFKAIDPLLDGLVDTLNPDTRTSDKCAGRLTAEWAELLGLPRGIAVGYGAFDCHMGAVAAKVRPGVLTKVMGTSTCDITVAEPTLLGDKAVPGICGQVDGSVVPGMIGLEAGQSAFGDLYAWFRDLLSFPLSLVPDLPAGSIAAAENQIINALSKAAAQLQPGQNGLTALDWVNGRRTPDASQRVSMAIMGLKMGSSAPQIFRALVEATAFGSRAINERFRAQGVPVDSITVIGGISKKSPLVMQICADVWNCDIDVLESEQSCALGAAIFAAVAAGAFPNVAAAQDVMASPVCQTYSPQPELVPVYDRLYQQYQQLGEFVELHSKQQSKLKISAAGVTA